VSVEADVFESLDQGWRQLVQFAGVIAGEAFEDATALAGDTEDGAALVDCVLGAGEEALTLGAIDEFDDAVVLEAEAGGGVGDGYGRRFRSACDLQKKLMLLRLESGGEGCALGEVKEAAQLEAEVGESAEEVGLRGDDFKAHLYIVARYNARRKRFAP
jgi:hypothetical protein